MSGFKFICTECGASYREHEVQLQCPSCARQQETGGVTRGVLEVVLDELPTSWPQASPSSAEFLTAFLPLTSPDLLAPIPVGATPLLAAPQLRHRLGLPQLWVKDDTRNPSGSTKDRASLLVVAKATEYGYDTVAAASTGNAATALAAIAAAAGVRAVTFVPHTTPEAKLVQMLNYGAEVIVVDGSYDDAFELCLKVCKEFGWYNRNTAINPFTIEGKKTAALEVAVQLVPRVPDVFLVPTGDGVILSGVAKGFSDLASAGLIDRRPRLIAVQPERSASIVTAIEQGASVPSPVPRATSVADSLNVQMPRNGLQCLQRIRESNGGGVKVSDDAIVEAIALLASTSGVFAEPAGAASLAGLLVALDEGMVRRDELVVLLVTGTGLKDIPAASRAVHKPAPIPATVTAVSQYLYGHKVAD